MSCFVLLACLSGAERGGRGKEIGRGLPPPQMVRFLYFALGQNERERRLVVTKRLPELVSTSRYFCRLLAIVFLPTRGSIRPFSPSRLPLLANM